VPRPEKRIGFCPDGGADQKKVKNHRWSKRLARTFKFDIVTCPQCGEEMEILGAVQDPNEVQRYMLVPALIAMSRSESLYAGKVSTWKKSRRRKSCREHRSKGSSQRP
jgi:hypothetical protein